MSSPDVLIARVAARRLGVFTAAEALACGFSPSMIAYRVRTGRWIRLHRGVYLILGAEVTFMTRVLAAVAAAGRDAVASHLTSGVLYRLEDLRPDVIEISVPRTRSARIAGVRVHHVDLPRTDRAEIAKVPVTTPPRTVIDLASVLGSDVLEDSLHDFVRRGMVEPRSLEARVAAMQRRGHRGLGKLHAMLIGLTSENVSGSGWENKVRRLLVRAGLDEPVRQFVIRDEDGNFVARPDLCYPEHRVYIEYHGSHHWDPKQRARDFDRQNLLSAVGWRPLIIIDSDFKKPPSAIASKVRRALTCR